MKNLQKNKQPIHFILLLILAGEAVFILPFVLARVFRPTFLDVFGLTNIQLGICFSIYGIIAMASYLGGGTLADRFKPRKLIALALFLTAIGGFFMATFPTYGFMKIIFGYWGFTTIFLFWGAMIKATRIWGGPKMQGRAFGFLDGGRGLVAASIGSIGVLIFSAFINPDVDAATLIERRQAFRYVILFSSFFVALIGVLVFFFMKFKEDNDLNSSSISKQYSLANFREVARIPSVWLLMIIILCAYVGYKITDVFSLYAKEVMLFNEVEAAKVGTFLLYIRPVVGISAGFLADRTRSSIWIILSFAIMIVGALVFASGTIHSPLNLFFFLSLLGTAIGVYAVRALYFAILKEGNIPLAITGTAVGFVSFVGYTPDIFVGPAMGYLLDHFPGIEGHQHVFMMLAFFSAIGFIASLVFYKMTKKNPSLQRL